MEFRSLKLFLHTQDSRSLWQLPFSDQWGYLESDISMRLFILLMRSSNSKRFFDDGVATCFIAFFFVFDKA